MTHDLTSSRVKRPDARRDELLGAARELLMTRDVADVTVADITHAADAAKGTFYRYFHGKEDLLMVLRMEFVRDLGARIRGRLEPLDETDKRGQIDELVRTAIRFQIANQRLHTVLFHQFRAVDVATTGEPAEQQHLVGIMTRFIESGNRDGQFTVSSPAHSARLLYHALNGAADEAAGTADPRAQEQMITAAVDLVWRTLTAAR